MSNFFDELKKAVLNENLYETNQVIEKIKKEKNIIEYIEYMLKLIENNSDLDFGNPGPMVHFMETYYGKGYEDLLLESVQRCPTFQTIWMINRIINDPKVKDKQKYIDILILLIKNKNLNKNLIDSIKELIDYHKNNISFMEKDIEMLQE